MELDTDSLSYHTQLYNANGLGDDYLFSFLGNLSGQSTEISLPIKRVYIQKMHYILKTIADVLVPEDKKFTRRSLALTYSAKALSIPVSNLVVMDYPLSYVARG